MKHQYIRVYSQQGLVEATLFKEGMKLIFSIIGFMVFLIASFFIVAGIILLKDTSVGWVAISLGCLCLSAPAMSIHYSITANHIEYYLEK